MKQTHCKHGSTFQHAVIGKDATDRYTICPGPLELKVEATTTKEGDLTDMDVETK